MTDLTTGRKFLEKLISSFPPEHQGVMGHLHTRYFNDNSARRVLNGMGDNICWATLLEHLIQEFPIVIDDNLFFKPKLLLFPLHLQRNIMSLLLSNAVQIPSKSLLDLNLTLDKYKCNHGRMDGWMETLHKLLKVRIKELNRQDCSEKCVTCVDVSTKESEVRFSQMCEKIKSQSYGKVDSQRIWDIVDYCHKDSNVTEKSMLNDLMQKQRLTDNCDEILQEMDVDEVEILEKVTVKEQAGNLLPEAPVFLNEDVMEEDEDLKEGVTKNLLEYQTNYDARDNGAEDNAVLQSKLKPLQNIMQEGFSLDSEQGDIAVQNALQIFNELSSTEIEYACQFLQLTSLQDENILQILCQSFLKLEPEPSYQNTSVFASRCIFPYLTKLQSAASRILVNLVMAFTDKHANVACDCIFLPLLVSSGFKSFQADIICKVIKEKLNGISINRLFHSLLVTKDYSDGKPLLWNDEILNVIQAMIDSSASLDQQVLGTNYVECLKMNSSNMAKSLKFTKLILSTIRKYHSLVSEHKQTFVNILDRNETFLKKAGMASLKKMT